MIIIVCVCVCGFNYNAGQVSKAQSSPLGRDADNQDDTYVHISSVGFCHLLVPLLIKVLTVSNTVLRYS